MKILFDQGTPVPLRQYLPEHSIATAYEKGWSELSNGNLLEEAEKAGFNVLITTDQNLQHQQNLSEFQITVIVLLSTSWPLIRVQIDKIRSVIDSVNTGSYYEISF